MARPQKKGLDYFPLDVNIFGDPKIEPIQARYGVKGVCLIIFLYCEIYREGYYIVFDEDYMYTTAHKLGLDIGLIKQVIAFASKRSLFDSTLFIRDTVLTSPGIQHRYQLAIKERAKKKAVKVNELYWLLDEEDTESYIKFTSESSNSEINNDKSTINNDKSTINDIKESKEKKRNNKDVATIATDAFKNYAFSAFDYDMTNKLINSMLRDYANARVPTSDDALKKWVVEIYRLRSKNSEDDIKKALEYAITDSFWKSNIRSTKKFKEKFETLLLQSKKGISKTNSFNHFEQKAYDYEALERELSSN